MTYNTCYTEGPLSLTMTVIRTGNALFTVEGLKEAHTEKRGLNSH